MQIEVVLYMKTMTDTSILNNIERLARYHAGRKEKTKMQLYLQPSIEESGISVLHQYC